jgi:hypothetical protein
MDVLADLKQVEDRVECRTHPKREKQVHHTTNQKPEEQEAGRCAGDSIRSHNTPACFLLLIHLRVFSTPTSSFNGSMMMVMMAVVAMAVLR